MTGLRSKLAHRLPRSVRRAARVLMRRLHERRHPGERELAVAVRLARTLGGTFIDVGAHAGAYLYAVSRHAERSFAFEPLPDLAARLRQASRRSVTVVQKALSDKAGVATLRIPVVGGSEQKALSTIAAGNQSTVGLRHEDWHEVAIETITLDAFVRDTALKNLTLMKIDVEGHEAAVLAGGMATIARDRPVLLMELESRHGTDVAFVFETLLGCGYHALMVDPGSGTIQTVSLSDTEEMQSGPRHAAWGPLRVRRYVNNFLFVPQERRVVLTQAGVL